MRRRLFIMLVIGALSLTSGVPASLAADIACDATGCISISKLSQNITAKLHNQVVGFVSVVGDLPTVFQGQARTAADPPRTAMLPDLPTNVASVTKLITTIAVLKSMAKHGLTLDSRISPYLYRDWKQGPLVDTITFRELLSHSAGFRENCNGNNTTYAVIKQQIADGVKRSDMVDQNGNPIHSYNNCNFAIFRELLPQMEHAPIATQPESLRAAQSASFYIGWVNETVFQPAAVLPRTCRPPEGTERHQRLSVSGHPLVPASSGDGPWDRLGRLDARVRRRRMGAQCGRPLQGDQRDRQWEPLDQGREGRDDRVGAELHRLGLFGPERLSGSVACARTETS